MELLKQIGITQKTYYLKYWLRKSMEKLNAKCLEKYKEKMAEGRKKRSCQSPTQNTPVAFKYSWNKIQTPNHSLQDPAQPSYHSYPLISALWPCKLPFCFLNILQLTPGQCRGQALTPCAAENPHITLDSAKI